MNAADNGIIAAKKINQFHSKNCMALTTGLFVSSKIVAQEQHVLQYGLAYTRSQFRSAS